MVSLKSVAMKNLFPISIIATSLFVLSGCVSISNTIDDDLYVVKGSQIPIGESLDDETNYGAYKYKKDRNNNNVRYSGDRGFNEFSPFFGNSRGMNSRNFMFVHGRNQFMSNPYQNFNSRFYNNDMMWAYYPGFGWSFVNPYFGNNNWHNNGWGNNGWGNNGWGNNGWGNNGWGNNGWGNNGWGNNGWNNIYGWNDNPWNNNTGWNNANNGWNNNNGGSSNSNHYRGPRGATGGGGVITRSSIPGTLKNSSTTGGNQPVTSGSVVKPVGNEQIMSRSNPSRSPEVSRTNGNVDYSRPGRIQGNVLNNTGNNSRGNVNSAPSRNSNIFNSPGNSSSGGVNPGRNSGGGSVGSPARTNGVGNGGGSTTRPSSGSSGGGGTTRPSSGSSGGGRR